MLLKEVERADVTLRQLRVNMMKFLLAVRAIMIVCPLVAITTVYYLWYFGDMPHKHYEFLPWISTAAALPPGMCWFTWLMCGSSVCVWIRTCFLHPWRDGDMSWSYDDRVDGRDGVL